MIKVNLIGTARKKAVKAGPKLAMPSSATPLLLLLIVLGSLAGGYWWYSTLNNQLTDLDSKIQEAEAQKAALEAVIKQDSIYETRKKALENRVKIIEGLQRGQVSPVVALDVLSEAIDKTEYVWLSSLDQTNTIFNMSGQGTSYEAVANFLVNLKNTGYFTNFDVPQVQEAGPGNFTFSLRCEFAPPRSPVPAAQPASTGGN